MRSSARWQPTCGPIPCAASAGQRKWPLRSASSHPTRLPTSAGRHSGLMAEWATPSIDLPRRHGAMRDAEQGVELGSAIADERAILRVLYTYCHAIDYGEEARWLALFTPDGIF